MSWPASPSAPHLPRCRRASAPSPLLDRVGLGGTDQRPAAELTYIDQKRLELARALALEPALLLLDEWLAGLNPRELGSASISSASLRRTGITIVLVEHVMDAIRSLCDRCVVMSPAARSPRARPPTFSPTRR